MTDVGYDDTNGTALDELHDFAESVGINRCWFHRGSGHPHYDITGPQREAALGAGAVPVTTRELTTLARRLRDG